MACLLGCHIEHGNLLPSLTSRRGDKGVVAESVSRSVHMLVESRRATTSGGRMLYRWVGVGVRSNARSRWREAVNF